MPTISLPVLWVFVAIVALGFFALLAGACFRLWRKAENRLMDGELDASTSFAGDLKDGELVEIEPPDVKTKGFTGIWGQLFRVWRHYTKRRKLLGKGYVQWVLVGDAFSRPTFVKPKSDGAGIPHLTHDKTKYLFPRSAMVPDQDTGLMTIMHRKGEADPINPGDPFELAIPTDSLMEYLQKGVTSTAPSLLDKFSINPKMLMWLGIGVIVVMAVLSGGLPH